MFPYGVLCDAREATATALLAGVVLDAIERTNELTGQTFVAARVDAGFNAVVCLCLAEHPKVPLAGQVVAGEVFFVASIPSLEQPTGRSRWWRRLRT